MINWLKRLFLGLIFTGYLLSSATSTSAQTSWNPGGNGVWFDPTNWKNGVTNPFPPPNAAGAWAAFGAQSGNPTRTITVNGTATVGRLSFTSQFEYILNSGGITLNNVLNNALIEKTISGTSTINTPLTLSGGTNRLNIVNTNTTGVLTLSSLSGTGSQVIVGSYTGTGVSGSTATGGVVVAIQNGSYGGLGSITEINGGVLRADEGIGLPTNTLLRINGTEPSGAGWEVTQNTTVTRSLGSSAGNIQILGTNAGFAALNGTLTLRLNGGGQIQWGSANFNPTTSLQFGRGVTGTPGVSDNYVFENGIDLNGATRTIRVGVGPGGIRATARLTGNLVNTSGTASGLTLTGSGGGGGTVELSGTNTYNGTSTVTGLTVLRANEGAGLSANSNLVLNGGILEGLGTTTFSRTLGNGAGQVRVIGGISGFSAFGGTHTIQLNGGTGTVVWGTTDFNPTSLQLNLFNSNALVDFQNGIDLNTAAGTARFIAVRDNPNSTADVARVSGVVSNSVGSGALVVGGNGTLELTVANTYTGQTVIFDAPVLTNTVVKLVGTGSIANSSTIAIGGGRSLDVTGLTGGANYSVSAGRFAVAPGQTLSGSGMVVGSTLVGPNASLRGGVSLDLLNDTTGQVTPTGELTIAGSLRLAGDGELAVDLNGASSSGALVSRVAVTGTGNVWDFDTTGGPVTIRLLNDQNLMAGQTYSFMIGSSSSGFTLNGNPVTEFTKGIDYVLSSNLVGFGDSSLFVSGTNLWVQFTVSVVPEPGAVLLIAATGLGLSRRFRRSTVAVG